MRVARCLGCLVAFVLVTADPALAHVRDTDAPIATNYRSEIVALDPDPGGVTVTRVGEGDLELLVEPGTIVVVHGYGRTAIEPEPYLRVAADGSVHVNRNSPALWLNEDRSGQAPVPAHADPAAAPDWRQRVPPGTYVTRWLDHRTRWMPAAPPEWVRDEPGSRHHISDWEVPLTVDGEPVVIRGTLEWIPDRSPWPAVAVALLAAVLVVAPARRWPQVIPVAAVIAAVAGLVASAGLWAHPETQLRATALVLPGLALLSGSVGLLRPWLGGAATTLASILVVVWAVPFVTVVVHPVVFSAPPAELVRTLIAVATGAAAGVIVAAARASRAVESTDDHGAGRIGRPR